MRKPKSTPKTNNERQRARRLREKEWLTTHGYNSWESLHTALMDGIITLDRVTPIYSKTVDPDKLFSAIKRKVKHS